MKLITKSMLMVAGMGAASLAFAADPLANTTWQTYEDGQPKAVVKITENNGVLSGKIIAGSTAKAKQYVGQTVISGLKADGNGKYSGGSITDPVKNKTYKLTANLNGNELNLKGHLGPFSRTQVWKKK